jgi:hypothetical protein
MPELLVLEFDGVGESQYNKVNTELGIDQATGDGNWPPGLITHIGAAADGGNLIVVEVWQSRQAQRTSCPLVWVRHWPPGASVPTPRSRGPT